MSDINRESGWYIVDHSNGDYVYRGPYRHLETANAVRTEMEGAASKKQNERWNLWVTWLGDNFHESDDANQSEIKKDAERYRALRFCGDEFNRYVVIDVLDARVGTQTYSGDRLDVVADEMIREQRAMTAKGAAT